MRARFPASNSRDHQQSKLGFLSIATPTDGNCVEGIETFYDALDDLSKIHFNEDALNEETFHDCLDNFSNDAGLDPEQKSALREAGSAIYNSIKDSFTSFTDAVLTVTKGEGASYGAKAIALGVFLNQFVTVSADDATTFSTDNTSTSDSVIGNNATFCDNGVRIPETPQGFPTDFTGISMQDCTVDGVKIHKDDVLSNPWFNAVTGAITPAIMLGCFVRSFYVHVSNIYNCCTKKIESTEDQDDASVAMKTQDVDVEADVVDVTKKSRSQYAIVNRFTDFLNRQQSRVTYCCGFMHGFTHMISSDTRYMILACISGLFNNGSVVNTCNILSTLALMLANLIGYFGLPSYASATRTTYMAVQHLCHVMQIVAILLAISVNVFAGNSLLTLSMAISDYALGRIQTLNNTLSGHIDDKEQKTIYGKVIPIGEAVCGIFTLIITGALTLSFSYEDTTLMEPHYFLASTLIGYCNFMWSTAHFMDYLFRKTDVGIAAYEAQEESVSNQLKLREEAEFHNMTALQKFNSLKEHIGAGMKDFKALLPYTLSMGMGYGISCGLFTRVLPDMMPGAINGLSFTTLYFFFYMIFNTAPRFFTEPLVNNTIAPIDFDKERAGVTRTLLKSMFNDRSMNSESVETFLLGLEESHRSNAEEKLVIEGPPEDQLVNAKESMQQILEFLKEAAKSVPMIDSESKDATVATESEDSATDDVKINPVDKLIQSLQNAVTFENPEQDAEATREFFEKLIEDLLERSEVKEVEVVDKLKEFLTSLKKPNTVINPYFIMFLHVCRLIIVAGGSIAAMKYPALRNFSYVTALTCLLSSGNGFLFTLATNTCQRLSSNARELGSIPLMTNFGIFMGFLFPAILEKLSEATGLYIDVVE